MWISGDTKTIEMQKAEVIFLKFLSYSDFTSTLALCLIYLALIDNPETIIIYAFDKIMFKDIWIFDIFPQKL